MSVRNTRRAARRRQWLRCGVSIVLMLGALWLGALAVRNSEHSVAMSLLIIAAVVLAVAALLLAPLD